MNKLEPDPRVTPGPSLFQSIVEWMRRAAQIVNALVDWVNAPPLATLASSAGFVLSVGTSSYIKFPSWLGGWIVQWGTTVAATNAGGDLSWSLPITFPNQAVGSLIANGDHTVNSGAVTVSTYSGYPLLGSLAAHVHRTDTNAALASTTVRLNWFVAGR